MRFEPRLFREDDEPISKPVGAASDELSSDLPDELAALGAQLRGDADALSLAYPAGRRLATEAARRTAQHGKRRWLRWGGAAAAVFLAAGTWGVIADRPSIDDSPPSQLVSAVSSGSSPTTHPLALAERSVSANKPIADESGLSPSIFRGLTGAEQEAVLDLMQAGDQHGQVTI